MGEYRVPVGMEYSSTICDLYKEKIFLKPAMEALGFPEENCPPKVVRFDSLIKQYFVTKWIIDKFIWKYIN